METGLVSVVVPIYKTEKYLDRCLTSIVNQTYRNLEILLIDDGSPDNCPRMCDDWARKDPRIRVIHKQNQGLGMARNTGIEHATGSYICFFDSDDYIAPDTIEKAQRLSASENADIVVYGMCNVSRSGEVLRHNIPTSQTHVYRGSAVQDRFLPGLIDNKDLTAEVQNLTFSAWSCLFSMELVKKAGWRFVSERELISEDSYSITWLYQYVQCVAVLPEALYYYCENESSLTQTYRTDRFEKIKHFYQESLHMAGQLHYGPTIHSAISGLFLSFSIAAMKQIAAAGIGDAEKKRLLVQITDDTAMQQALADISSRRYGRSRQILFWAMRRKCYGLVCFLVSMKAKKKR